MKLPIHLAIESDSVWTTYKSERDACDTVESLRKFMERWKALYPFKVNQILLSEDILQTVKSEKVDDQDMIATNIILPNITFRAMMIAKEYEVPLNTAFIQANGGMEAFES